MTKAISGEEAVSDASQGLVFTIQRFSIQDGPGIRTTVFLKGCPLRCEWCSNPESQHPYPEIMARSVKCQGCGTCVTACPQHAITLPDKIAVIDRSACRRSFHCVSACLNDALEVTGKVMSLETVLAEVCRDEPFYRNSGGGVTLSGGEPLSQPAFSAAFFKHCRERSLSTVLDTCGYAPWETLEAVLAHTDLVLYDLKHLDSERHRQGTGVRNDLILENLQRLAESGLSRIWVRIPLIGGYNDSEDDLRNVARLVRQLPVEKVSLLAYHQWGRPKYGFLGREYACRGDIVDEKRLAHLQQLMIAEGIPVTVGH